jgi:hypothetical protein
MSAAQPRRDLVTDHLRNLRKNREDVRRGLYVLALALSALACGRDPLEADPWPGGGTGPDEELAQLTVTVSDVPTDVHCVSLLIAADTSETRKFDLQPGQPAELNLARVPTGSVVFTADAFPKRCADVSGGSVATWTGGPKTVTLQRGANPTVVIVMRPNSQVKVRLEFDPGAPRTMCADGGAACSKDGECCSQQCTASLKKDGKRSDRGKCSQDAPPGPTAPVKTSKQPLEGTGGRAAFPAFDGDTFFVTFPRKTLEGPVPTPEVRRLFIEPALRAVGFERLGQLSSPEAGRALPGGNFSQLLAAVCQPSRGSESLSDEICGVLANQDQVERASAYVRRALGQSLASLQREIGRGLEFWYFVQYEGEVPIEHKAVVALRYGGQQVSSVFGSFLNNYAPSNQVLMSGDAAVARGLPHLLQLENLDPLPATPAPAPDAGAPSAALERPTLVLLPYGTVRSEGGSSLTAVRYAYRAGLAALRPQKSGPGQRVGYTVWVDAETGQILKFDPDFNDASVQAQSWCRDPANNQFGDAETCPVTFDITGDAMAPRFLENASFARLQAVGSVPPSMSIAPGVTDLMNGGSAAYGVCTFDGSSSEFRQVSTFAQLNRGLTLVSAGGFFTPFPNGGKINVSIDSTQANSAVLSTLQLTFSNGEGMSSPECQNVTNSQLNGAQDMTIVSHELAHLATLNLQNVLQTGCRSRCPTTNKKNRQFFHDYSDGYATMISRSPCIGGWMAKNVSAELQPNETPTGDQAQLAESCMRGFEAGALPRLLVAENDNDIVDSTLYRPGRSFVGQPAGPSGFKQDAFPEHHELNQGEYADGQIVGAALWGTFRGVTSHSPLVGELALWGRINQGVLASGFTTRTCGNSCDDSTIYSAAREFLFHVANGWLGSEGNQDANKLLSAFARAGIFLVPVSCFDGDAAVVNTALSGLPLDAHFCPDGEVAADAIVDFYDGDNRDLDGEQFSGVVLHEDDYARPDDTAYFRVWTGPNFIFNGKVAVQGDRRCNTNYVIEYWPEDPAVPGSMFSSDAHQELPGTTVDCYARVAIPNFSQLGTGPIRYRVRTFTPTDGAGEANVRWSTEPGFGLWNNNGVQLPASVFYVNADGRPELPPVQPPPPPPQP